MTSASLRTAVIANYVSAGTAMAGPVLALPWYLALLGEQQFGLVAFITALQGVLSVLDAGLSQAIVRKIALLRLQESAAFRLAGMLRSCERLYWALALLIGTTLLLAHRWLAHNWLDIPAGLLPQATAAVFGAIAIFILQFPGSLYRSVLVGTERQVTLSAITTAIMIARHAGAVALLMEVPTVQAYVLWHGVVAIAEVGLRAHHAWRATGASRRRAPGDHQTLMALVPSLAGLGLASVLGALTAQLDRLFLSFMAPIDQLGRYAIASTLAMGALQLFYPVMQAVTPRIIALRAQGIPVRSMTIRLGSRIAAGLLIVGVAYSTCGIQLLEFWLRDRQVAEAVYPILALLLCGSALNAIYALGHLRWLAQGRVRMILGVNLAGAVLCAVTLPISIHHFGAAGAAVGWIAANLLGLAACLIDPYHHER